MNNLEAGVFSVEHNLYLIDAYSPLLLAAGYAPEDVRRLHGPDVYFLYTALRGAVKHRAKYIVEGPFGHHDYIGAVRSMTLNELRALRERFPIRRSK
jgi:hypothetical protein